MKATTPITSAAIMAAGLLWYEIDDSSDIKYAEARIISKIDALSTASRH